MKLRIRRLVVATLRGKEPIMGLLMPMWSGEWGTEIEGNHPPVFEPAALEYFDEETTCWEPVPIVSGP